MSAMRLLFALLSALVLINTARAAERPNVILLIADDMAWNDCGAYGNKHIRTPNIDRLAKEGLRCDRAFLTTSSCSPSRASIITGRYPHNTGAEKLHMPLPAKQVTFPELLKQAGYYTAAAGKWHLGGPAKAKFDLVKEGGGPGAEQHWLPVLRGRPKDKPFFLWLAATDPHRPYAANAIPRPHAPADVTVPPFLPDTLAVRKDFALYYDEIARLDHFVGEVLAELDRQKVADNTLMLFITDNGRPFPRCKTTLYDSGIKTPLLARWPARIKPGGTSKSLVSAIDIAPTILELAGLKAGSTFQGRSFAGLFDDPTATVRDYAFAEHNWHDFDDHQRAVRSPQFLYVRSSYTDIPLTPPADAVRGATFQELRRLRDAGKLTPAQMTCFVKPRPAEELYDCDADPYQMHNLAADSAHAKTLAALRAELARWEKATDDHVPARRTPDKYDRETGVGKKN
jgi:arylsulfatase A-like enzyme